MGNRIAVTGANGLIGRALCARLSVSDVTVRALTRNGAHGLPNEQAVGAITSQTDWRPSLEGVDAIVHCAARVHVMDRTARRDEAGFRRVNTQGTLHLARVGAEAGVRRLIFLSTIKVNGESAPPQAPFTAHSPSRPEDAYARSKAEAEKALWRVADETGLEVVVIRPPLVHAPAAGGNLADLRRLIRLGIPLPLAGADNPRSVIGIANLVDGIQHCLFSPAAAGHVWLMRDPEMPTVAELVRILARSEGRRQLLFPLPGALLRGAGRVLGQQARVARVLDSLCMDIRETESALGWRPPFSLEAGLSAAKLEQGRPDE